MIRLGGHVRRAGVVLVAVALVMTAAGAPVAATIGTGGTQAAVGGIGGALSEQRGDVVPIEITGIQGSDYVTVTLGSQDSGYISNVTVQDDGDNAVTLRWNSFLADSDQGPGENPWSAAGGDSVVRQEVQSSIEDGPEQIIAAGDYRVTARAGRSADAGVEAIAEVSLSERTTEGVTSWTATADSSPQDLQDLQQLAGDSLTRDSTIAEGDLLVTQIDASGLEGALAANDGNPTEQFYGAVANDDISLTYTERDTGPNTRPTQVVVSEGSTGYLDGNGFVRVIPDAENDAYYVVVDTDRSNRLDPTMPFETEFRVTSKQVSQSSYGLVAPNSDGSFDDEVATSDFEMVEPAIGINTALSGSVEVYAERGQAVGGTSSLAPGTDLDLEAISGEDAAVPYLLESSATVTADGTWTATFDFSNQEENVGTGFDLEVTGAGVTTNQSGLVRGQPTVNALVFPDQQSAGEVVIVSEVNLSAGGFVGIYRQDGGGPGELLGYSNYLRANTQNNRVGIVLDQPIARSQTLIAVPHKDTDSDQEFDANDGSVDDPYTTQQGATVTRSAFVDTGSSGTQTPSATPSATATVTPTKTATPTETPTPTVQPTATVTPTGPATAGPDDATATETPDSADSATPTETPANGTGTPESDESGGLPIVPIGGAIVALAGLGAGWFWYSGSGGGGGPAPGGAGDDGTGAGAAAPSETSTESGGQTGPTGEPQAAGPPSDSGPSGPSEPDHTEWNPRANDAGDPQPAEAGGDAGVAAAGGAADASAAGADQPDGAATNQPAGESAAAEPAAPDAEPATGGDEPPAKAVSDADAQSEGDAEQEPETESVSGQHADDADGSAAGEAAGASATADAATSETAETGASDAAEAGTAEAATDAPAESDPGQPVEEDTEEPADTESREPTDADAGEPTESTAAEPAEAGAPQATDAGTDQPADASAGEPADADTEQPAETAADAAAEPPADDTDATESGAATDAAGPAGAAGAAGAAGVAGAASGQDGDDASAAADRFPEDCPAVDGATPVSTTGSVHIYDGTLVGPDASTRARFFALAADAGDVFEERASCWQDLGENVTVAPVFEVETEPTPWLAFDPGHSSLAEMHPNLQWDELVQIIGDIGDALQAATGAGQRHGDLTPDSVRLTRLDNGVVTTSVADWGVRGDVAEAVGEETLTPYTAPEQVAGEAAGTRTDVYRYAAVAYFMLTGYVPYAEAEDLATAISEEGPPSATTANPNLTTATGNVLQWAMSTDPEDRYATPAAFKQALTETLR